MKPMVAMLTTTLVLGLLAAPNFAGDADRPEILVADFEGKDYAGWVATGEAFGPGPARGTLPGQMEVSGYLGHGLVNSFFRGDDPKGTLTSPGFTIERPFINFLIGGGGYPGETCVNLIVDGRLVRTATGPNTEPGGSERLRWHSWDVRELQGKPATIQVVDNRAGGWGHINIDHFVLGDVARQAAPARREFQVTSRYLHLPVHTGGPKQRMKLSIEGHVVREFEIELAEGRPDFSAFADLGPFQGKTLVVAVDSLEPRSRALEAIVQREEIPDAGSLYREKNRPQFHFTSRRGWNNDPNGLVWQGGKYHLFYQHNPYGWNWGNMHWGHAVSSDLVHWKEHATALYPPRFNDWCFSGSAVVDTGNTGGFQSGSEPPLVAAFTSTGRGECIVFSNDGGETFREYPGNPVVKHPGRDPKLVWHGPSKSWVMAVYDEQGGKQGIAIHTSPDLRHWTFRSKIAGFYECPDLFELPVVGEAGKTRWVLHAADAKYVLGDFDGREFRPESGKDKLQVWYGNFYAPQSFSNVPDGRRIQIGWASGVTFPGMPFNQQMSLPVRLTLRPADGGKSTRMFAEPVEELKSLRGRKQSWSDLDLAPGENPLRGLRGDLVEIEAEFSPGTSDAFVLSLRGIPLTYDVRRRELSCKDVRAPLEPVDGRIRLRVFQDRGSIEVFGNDGRVALSVGAIPADDDHSLSLRTRGGTSRIRSLVVHELRSAW